MYRDHNVAVVMPVHNERDHVGRAISRVPRYVDSVVVVDDGSTDETWSSLESICDQRLIKIRHRVNRGVGGATKTGYRCALESRADLIAVMDGDGQMDGEDLHRLLDCAITGVDYVKGNRFLDPTICKMPLVRYAGNTVLSILMRFVALVDDQIDSQCGYTVVRRDALKRIDLDQLYDRYGFLNEMIFAVVGAGMSFKSIPVKTIYGNEVSGVNPLTAVPTILYLIARHYLRTRLAVITNAGALRFKRAGASRGE